jgi:acyl transferase domain-containing protein
MTKATVLMFSGQGSHYYQMGRDLFDNEPVFRKAMLEMDAIAEQRTGCSVLRALYHDRRSKADRFDSIAVTHPAIFMVELALARTLADRGVVPDYVLGASLGAFAAAAVARCLSPEQALVAVIEQASIVAERCEPGGMLAILDAPERYAEPTLSHSSELAARNFSSHFVVAATEEGLDEIASYLSEKRVTFERLALTYAFHSRWIDAAQEPYCEFLDTLRFDPAQVPIVCCAGARTLEAIPNDYFWTVARDPIRFPETIEHLERKGSYRYVDAGPAGTLATYLKYILPAGSASEVCRVLSPFGRDLQNLQLLRPH